MNREDFKAGDIVIVESGDVLAGGITIVRCTKTYRINSAMKSLYWIEDMETGMTDRIGKSSALLRAPSDAYSAKPYHRIIGKA